MILRDHIEKLFLYVIELNQYLIVMSFSWLRRHVIEVNFEFNIFIMFSLFCLAHCCSFLVKIYDITREEEEFLSLKKFQRIWEFEDQKNQSNFNYVISSSLVSIAHKKQFNF